MRPLALTLLFPRAAGQQASAFGTSAVPSERLGFKRTEGGFTGQNEGMQVMLSELMGNSDEETGVTTIWGR